MSKSNHFSTHRNCKKRNGRVEPKEPDAQLYLLFVVELELKIL